MITTNERRYRITRKRAADFAGAIEDVNARSQERTDVHPTLLRAELEAMKSQLVDLREELEEHQRTST